MSTRIPAYIFHNLSTEFIESRKGDKYVYLYRIHNGQNTLYYAVEKRHEDGIVDYLTFEKVTDAVSEYLED